MKYEILTRGGAKFWHPSATADQVESAFGMRAVHRHSVGDLRLRGDRSPYSETYCAFDLVDMSLRDAEDTVSACLIELKSRKEEVSKLIDSGGKFWLIVKVYSEDILQFSFEWQILSQLSAERAGLVFEFYSNANQIVPGEPQQGPSDSMA